MSALRGIPVKNLVRALIVSSLFFMHPICKASSFDCQNVPTAKKRAVCTSPTLSRLNEQVTASYQRALLQSPNQDERNAIISEQKKWLTSLKNCRRDDVDCLEHRYRRRVLELSIDCTVPSDQEQNAICGAEDLQALYDIVGNMWAEWRPYISQLQKMERNDDRAYRLFYVEIDRWHRDSMMPCLSWQCRRSMTKSLIEHQRFPVEAYTRLRNWVTSEGMNSSLLNSEKWKLTDEQAVPAWNIVDSNIYILGELPKWFTRNVFENHAFDIAPFMDRPFTDNELWHLAKLVKRLYPTWLYPDMKVDFLGITPAALRSVIFLDGGGAKCSPHPFNSSVMIDKVALEGGVIQTKSHVRDSFKIIEIRDQAGEQPTPTCTSDDPRWKVPKTYKSRIFINEIQSVFVRADGTFWLKFSDGEWYRFRADMTSDALEIGTKFHVISETDFNQVRDDRTAGLFEEKIMNAIRLH